MTSGNHSYIVGGALAAIVADAYPRSMTAAASFGVRNE